jgi:lipoprotein-anchoring transpeptidase ErfK/SrfK
VTNAWLTTNAPVAPVVIKTSAPPVVSITNTAPAPLPPAGRTPSDILEVQLALARQCISCGSLDGTLGSQTRAALRVFQTQQGIEPTGRWDSATKALLKLDAPTFTTFIVSSNDLAQLQPLSNTWLGKSQQSALAYESLLELVSERFQSHPALIKKLNPGVNWDCVTAGTELIVPNAVYPPPALKADHARIRLAERVLDLFDCDGKVTAHFPCSIGRRFESRPVGELHVVAIAPHPNYTFSPEVFPESEEARQLGRKLILPPGPNNPVGVAWIGLDRPGYGIHGTPVPEQVGRTESHGCFRLANWNAEYFLDVAWVGMPVLVEP